MRLFEFLLLYIQKHKGFGIYVLVSGWEPEFFCDCVSRSLDIFLSFDFMGTAWNILMNNSSMNLEMCVVTWTCFVGTVERVIPEAVSWMLASVSLHASYKRSDSSRPVINYAISLARLKF
jgi:hypothetical protein